MELTVHVPDRDEQQRVVGVAERNLKMLREALGVSVSSRDGVVRLSGKPAQLRVARAVLERLREAARRRHALSREDVLAIITDVAAGDRYAGSAPLGAEGWDGRLDVYAAGRAVVAKTANQERYIRAIRDNDLIFGVGPAGTGKTYLAVAAAVHMLKQQRVSKVVLCRPAVEAGEKLGFLPGDLEAKVNPYLRPLLDALHDMLPYHDIRRFMDTDVLEVVPLAFMRGRTLNASVIILEEAKNSTRAQLQMILTRMGHGSKMIVTGDTTQIDLPEKHDSGLVDAVRRLRGIPRIDAVTFAGEDVVRHSLVQRIVEAYGGDETTGGSTP